jgi:hypothetical protein
MHNIQIIHKIQWLIDWLIDLILFTKSQINMLVIKWHVVAVTYGCFVFITTKGGKLCSFCTFGFVYEGIKHILKSQI